MQRMHAELVGLRKQYDVPENVKQDLETVDRHYHSEAIREKALGK